MCKITKLNKEINRLEIDNHYIQDGKDFANRFAQKPELLDQIKLKIQTELLFGRDLTEICKKYVWH